jgi:malonyl-CoA O-methyltransferase
MSAPLKKSDVAANFSAAADSYDGWAMVQQPAAHYLVDSLPEGFAPRTVLDIGCGTGALTRRLTARFPEARIAGIDLAPAMVGVCRAAWPHPHIFLCGDAEDFDAEGNAFDLIASSFAFQWFADQPGTLKRFAPALTPGGILALAVPVAGTLSELSAAHQAALDRPLAALTYPPEDAFAQWVAELGLSPLTSRVLDMVAYYPDALSALKSFKGIGATFRGATRPLSPREIGRLTRTYEDRFRTADGVPVTYRVLNLVARN